GMVVGRPHRRPRYRRDCGARRPERLARGPVLRMKGADVPVLALVLFAIFAALGFGWRSWEQRRRTGSTGFRGVSGRPGSAEWFAGVGFVVAVGGAPTRPVL